MTELRRCIADFSGISRIRLAVVGEFSRTDVEAMWTRLAELPPARLPYERIRDVAAPTSVDDRPVIVAMPDRPNAEVQGIALLRIAEDAPDFPALRIAVRLLGGDTDSRIRARLREREGLAYSAGASLAGSNFEPRSRLSISTSVASSNAESALAMLKEELARALAEGFSEAEVTRAKLLWKQERSKSLTAENSLVRQLSQGMFSGRNYAWQARFDRQIDQLGAAEVTEAFRKYLADASLVWSMGKGL
jgi:zinc protease